MSWMLLAALFMGSLVAAQALSPSVALALAVTLAAWAWQRQQARLDQFEARLRQTQAGAAAATPAAGATVEAPAPASVKAQPEAEPATLAAAMAAPAPEDFFTARTGRKADLSATPPPRPAATTQRVEDTGPATTSSLGATLKAWVLGGNTIVRLAVLILFVGVAFLVRYAADHALLPIELRLAAVVLGGMLAVGLGWRLRRARRDYALTLQGGGIGVIYLVLFAALRLYGLLPPGLAFALLVALSALTAVLALGQDAMVLAVVAFAGAFLAPVLTSTGQGNHVMLFSYYGVLNLAIAWLAQRRAWKLLNTLGFVFTFGIGLAWGLRNWQPELLASTEPFLIAHLLLYLFITVQYSKQLAALAPPRLAIVDGSLLFGVPIAAFGMQAAMVRHLDYGVAISAAILAGVYLLLARWLWQRLGERMRLLTEGMLALGVVFLALVAPLALDERWTAAAWALQGAGVAWVALRQRRAAALGLGLALQLLAAVQFWGQAGRASGALFITNAHLAGALLLAAAALFTARQLRHAAAPATPAAPGEPMRGVQRLFTPLLLQRLHVVALGLGLLHAWAGLSTELAFAPFAHPGPGELNALLLAGIALALEWAQQRLAWPALRLAARGAMAAALVLLSLSAVMAWGHVGYTGGHVDLWPHYRDGALLSLAALLAAALWLLRRLDVATGAGGTVGRTAGHTSQRGEHGLWHGTALLHAALLAYALASAFITRHQAWTPSLALAAPLALMLWFLARQRAGKWPCAQHPRTLQWGLAWPLLGLGLLWLLAVNLHADGAMLPLPYLPLVNPIDLGHALLALYAWRLWRSTEHPPFINPKLALAVGALAGFVWLNAMVVRSLHHWAGTPLWLHGAWHAGGVQTAFTILWSLCALAAMFVANQRAWRAGWMAGAVLLGVVVLKLALVDLSHTGALLRIVSFIGVGLLMLLIGYLSPLPPARKEAL